MPLRKFRAAMSRRLDDARDAAQQNIPAEQLRNQIAPANLGPRGNTGAGYTPAAHAASHEDSGSDVIDLGSLAGELTDAQHGDRGGGTLHDAATGSVAGFMSAADKAKEDLYPAISGLTPGDVLTALTSSTVGFAPGGTGSGTVTSVGLTVPAEFSVSNSPITTSGDIALTWANESANRVLAGPTTGSPGTPAFRALVAADIPDLSATYQILDGDLTALAGLSSTGLAARTAANTWAQRTITGASNRISVSNGNGVSGNPTLDIDVAYVGQSSITTLGTIATGTWHGTVIDPTYGGTGVNNGSNLLTVPATGTAALLGTAQTFSALKTFSAGISVPRPSGSALFAIDGTAAGSALSVANNATATPFGNSRNFSGLLVISETAVNGAVAVFLVDGGNANTVLISQVGTAYTNVATSASKINVYMVSGAVTIENKLGSTISLNIVPIRTRTL